ncbi:SatD family protein [Nocardioides aestuarii]|uniref:SatD family protein n=1 Tax=Nocardioides aestuarii TaxID=252231 RepID=A0ABW4TT33_9ACTN
MLMAAVLGDLVGSRRSEDRVALHARVQRALAEVNEMLSPVVPLRLTVGDEYQGGFATVGEAVRATLRLRLALAADVRHGLGWGSADLLQDEPRVEDGPAWWVARDAIVAVEEEAARPATRWRRTSYRRAEGTDGPDPATLEAMLILRDRAVADLDDRGLRLLDGLLGGRTQRDLADDLGISASAVSQRVRSDGLSAIVAADEALVVAP